MTLGDRNMDVRLRLDGTGPLHPGTTREVGINFLDVEHALPYLGAGTKFRLREASVIGEGEFLEIFARDSTTAALGGG